MKKRLIVFLALILVFCNVFTTKIMATGEENDNEPQQQNNVENNLSGNENQPEGESAVLGSPANNRNTEGQEEETDSVVLIENNLSYSSSYNDQKQRYDWFIDVESLDSPVDVVFSKNSKYKSWTVEAIEIAELSVAHPIDIQETGNKKVSLELKHDYMYITTGTLNDDTVVTQKHYIRVQPSNSFLAQRIVVTNIAIAENDDVDLIDYKDLQEQDNLFKEVVFNFFTSKDLSTLVLNIEELQKQEDYNTANYKDLSLESNYFTLTFKEGFEVIDKKYRFETNPEGKFPKVKYVLKKANSENIYEVSVVSWPNGPSGGPQDESIIIDNNRYIKRVSDYHGQQYTAYVSENFSGNIIDVFNNLNFEYDSILIKYNFNPNPETVDIVYDDGTFLMTREKYYVEVYLPTQTQAIEQGIDLSDLQKYTTPFSHHVTYMMQRREGPSSQIQNDYKYYLRNGMGYYDSNNKLCYVSNVFTNKEDFNQYHDNEPAILLEMSQQENGSSLLILQLKTKATAFALLEQYRNGNNIQTATQGGVEEFAPGGNEAVRLVQRIEALNNTYGSTIKLTGNLTLTENAILAAFLLGGIESDTDTRHLTIDLNGKTVDVGANELHVPQNCAVRIINSSETQAKIIGSGATVIKNYNLLNIDGNILISNPNGAAVTVINDQRRTTIKDNVILSGKIGLNWITRPRGAYSMNPQCAVNFSGEINKATEYGIKVDLPRSFNNMNYSLFLEKNDPANKNVLTSDNVGIYINGDVHFRSYNYDITSKKPFVIFGGTYDLNQMNVTASEGSIFTVDSGATGAGETKISINLEGDQPDVDIVASRYIVEELSETSQSKIASVNMTAAYDPIVWFKYTDSLFYHVPEGVVSINTGMYINKDYENYIDPTVLAQYTISTAQHTVQQNNYTYYKLQKPNTSATVRNYDELYQALVIDKKTIIEIGSDFDCSGNTIEFEVDRGTIFNMNGYKIENVKLIADALRYSSTASDCELKINNGSIVNSDSNHLNAVVLNGAKLRLSNATIDSNGNAVVMNNGSVELRNESVLKGRNAINVNIQKENIDYYFGDIQSNSGSKIIGVDSEAIKLENTYDKNGTVMIVYLKDSEISVVPDSYGHLDPGVSAIKLNDVAHVSLKNSSVNGGKYGVEFADSAIGTRECEVKMEDASITAVNGIRLNSKARANIIKGDITAQEDAIYAQVADKDQFSMVWMYDGNISVGSGENDHVVEYKGNIIPPRRDQIMVGGYFSKEVAEINLGVDPQDRFDYVCLQVNPLTDPYPYAIVRQYNPNVRVFQSISNSIHRDPIADQQLLENAISDKEKEYLEESSGEAVDIVFTITPETSAENINKMPKNLRGVEYYDIHINKNVGQNKQVVDEVTRYQLITMSLNEITGGSEGNNYDPEKVVVYHRHGNGDAKVMKKVSEADGKLLREECYYITNVNGNYYINLVTRRFSTFAIGDQENRVDEQLLKPNYELTLNYETEYVEGSSAPSISTATYNGTQTINVSQINVVYEGTGETKYFSSSFPTSIGTYKAIWTVKEDSTSGITGSGESEFAIVSSHVHKMTHYIGNAATCTTEGNIEYWYCSDCQKYFSDENGNAEVTNTKINKLEHSLTHYDRVEPGCTTSGNKEYWRCETCRGYFLTVQATEAVDYNSDILLAATEHNTTHHEAVAATCTADGNKEYWYCSNCKKYFLSEDLSEAVEESETIVNKLGHNMTHVTANEATCEEPGNYEYWYCSRCKNFFKDKDGNEEFTTERIIPKLNHLDENDDGICDRESCKKVLRVIVQEDTNEKVENFVKDNLDNNTGEVVIKDDSGSVVQITEEDPISSMEVIISDVSLDALPDGEKEKVEQITKKTDSAGNEILTLVVDIKIKVTTLYEKEYTLTEFKSETDQMIPIEIQIPENMIPSGNQVVKVYTIHDGVLKEVGVVTNIDENGKGILYAKEFSTYIFALESKPTPAPSGDSGNNKHYSLPKTGI